MPDVDYNYSITNDFPGGKVNLDRFNSKLSAFPFTPAFRGVSTEGGTLSQGVLTGGSLTITFVSALPTGEKTSLDGDVSNPCGGLIAAHNNAITPSAIVPVEVESFNSSLNVYTRRPPGGRAYTFSCDFCKRETWYVNSTKVTNEAVGTGDGTTTIFYLDHGSYTVTNEAIVDLCHYKVTDDYLIAPPSGNAGDYVPIVKLDGVTKAEREAYESTGGDYTIDYTLGKITFFTAPATDVVITCTYYYVAATTGPKIQFSPPAGKKWTIDRAEAQFSADVDITDTMCQNIFLKGTETPVYIETRLANAGNILDYTLGTLPVLPAFGGSTRGLTQDTILLRWDYTSPIVINASDNVEVRVWTKHSRGFGGERVTIAFYALEEEEE